MKIRPTKNSVFIEPVIDKHKGLIELPQSVQTEHLPHKGKVVAIAPNAKVNDMPVEFKVGDTVIFNRYNQNYSGLPTVDGKKITIVDAGDVMAVLE